VGTAAAVGEPPLVAHGANSPQQCVGGGLLKREVASFGRAEELGGRQARGNSPGVAIEFGGEDLEGFLLDQR
jgi:hypothetical protein